MVYYEVLPGLPGTGPYPEQYSASGTGTFREGLVVKFTTSNDRWIGNFQPGFTGYEKVFLITEEELAVVIAGGQGYIVNTSTRELVDTFDSAVSEFIEISERNMFISHDSLRFIAYGPKGRLWESRRISWDGIQDLCVVDRFILGESWDPISDKWIPFKLDLEDGNVEGGSFGEYVETHEKQKSLIQRIKSFMSKKYG